jgi:hypothetical protein
MTPYEYGAELARLEHAQTKLASVSPYEAGAYAAAQEAGLEKTAFIGMLARGVGLAARGIGMLGRGAGAAIRGAGSLVGGAGELVGGAGRMFSGGGRAAGAVAESANAAANAAHAGQTFTSAMGGQGFMKSVMNPAMAEMRTGWGNAMKPISGAMANGNYGQAAWQAAKSPLGKDMLFGGALNGGLAAATADPGDRMSAGLKGFGWGAAGGAAFKGVHGLASNALKTAPVQVARNAGGMKGFGAKVLSSPMAIGTAASMALPTGMPEAPQNLPMSNLPNAAAHAGY